MSGKQMKQSDDHCSICDYDSTIVCEDSNVKNIWLNSSEAASYLRISVKALHNLNSLGRVPYYKMGRSNKYLASELDDLVMAQPRGLRNGHQTNRPK